MRRSARLRVVRSGALALGVVFASLVPALARAQWAPVEEVPATRIFSVSVNGDTIAAGADTTVFLSFDAGKTWRGTNRPVAGSVAIEAARMRNGRLFAGTFGQGVHVSDDLGVTWHPFNEGLVGGFQDSQLDVTDLEFRGDLLVAATAGAGVYARSLVAGTWSPFGAEFEPNQDSNVNALTLGGTRLLALAGANGDVFFRDPGDVEWTISRLDNIGIHAGLTAQSGVFNGVAWVVGTNSGLFRSTLGQEPWTRFAPGLGPVNWTALANQGRHLFVAFDVTLGAVIEDSGDDGVTWDNAEFLPDAFVFDLAVSELSLYAARGDGLWRLPLATAGVASSHGRDGLHFALVGAQPLRDQARLRFELPEAATATIEVFDVSGRRMEPRVERTWSAGTQDVSLDARRLSPGVYLAVLTSGGRRETARLVHVR